LLAGLAAHPRHGDQIDPLALGFGKQKRNREYHTENGYVSESEAESNFADLMEKVRAGGEVVIESGKGPAAVLRPAEIRHRTVSESLALAQARARRLGYESVMDEDYAADMRETIANRKPRDTSAWD
jgi:antitoxin (DNA-binding transcriptional repressor) of toxin-antitoxin stability system